jgi:hypothetical protein
MAAVKRLSFEKGSSTLVGIAKSAERVLRKKGYITNPHYQLDFFSINPFAIMTGKRALPLPLMHPTERTKRGGKEIILDPIMICVRYQSDGGCDAEIWADRVS